MKKLITLICILISINTIGQTSFASLTSFTKEEPFELNLKIKKIDFLHPILQKNDWVIYTAQFIAGLADGVREEVLYHPNELFRTHPNLNRQYWDSRISWMNKNGRSKLFLPFSDANHTLRLIVQTSNLVSISFSFGELSKYPKKERWKVIAKKMLLSYAANKAVFATSYYLYFK